MSSCWLVALCCVCVCVDLLHAPSLRTHDSTAAPPPPPQLPTGARAPLPYLLALAPPLVGGILFPGIFFDALDFAGT